MFIVLIDEVLVQKVHFYKSYSSLKKFINQFNYKFAIVTVVKEPRTTGIAPRKQVYALHWGMKSVDREASWSKPYLKHLYLIANSPQFKEQSKNACMVLGLPCLGSVAFVTSHRLDNPSDRNWLLFKRHIHTLKILRSTNR